MQLALLLKLLEARGRDMVNTGLQGAAATSKGKAAMHDQLLLLGSGAFCGGMKGQDTANFKPEVSALLRCPSFSMLN